MIFYKLSRFNGKEIDGHECVNEVVASRLMRILGIEHLEYRLIHAKVTVLGEVRETWLNTSRNFRKKGERKQALDAFYELRKMPGETPEDFCRRFGWEDDVKRMMVVDWLIANRDRHGSNIEVLVDGLGVARLAPIFDNGLSLVAPYAGDEERLLAFDPLTSVRTNNYLGSRLLEENLQYAADVDGIGSLSESDKDVLLDGLEGSVSNELLDKIWDIVWERWKVYAALRDSK